MSSQYPHPQAVLLIGAGGHAKVIVDMLMQSKEWMPMGCTDRREGSVLHLPILGSDDLLPSLYEQGLRYAFVAIGNNERRMTLAEQAARMGYSFATAVHPRAYVAPSAHIGTGTAVMAGAVIQPEAELGTHVIINTGATVDHDCRIGDGVHLAPGVHLAGQVRVGSGAFLGVGAKVVPGVAIGQRAVVGAGAVVRTDIPDDCLAVGVPARIIRYAQGANPHIIKEDV